MLKRGGYVSLCLSNQLLRSFKAILQWKWRRKKHPRDWIYSCFPQSRLPRRLLSACVCVCENITGRDVFLSHFFPILNFPILTPLSSLFQYTRCAIAETPERRSGIEKKRRSQFPLWQAKHKIYYTYTHTIYTHLHIGQKSIRGEGGGEYLWLIQYTYCIHWFQIIVFCWQCW